MTANKTPPSEMIRVPTPLIPVVRHLAKIHRDGHTTALLQGLQELIAQFDSSVKKHHYQILSAVAISKHTSSSIALSFTRFIYSPLHSHLVINTIYLFL